MCPQSHAHLRGRAAVITLAVILAACGGGGGSTTTAGGGDTSGSTPAPPAATGPAITTQPQSQSVVAGQAVTFSVAADSTTLSYQWQRDGKDIPGATSFTYTLANPQAADNGSKFTAVATGAKGSTTSAAAVLGVSVPKGLALVAGAPGGRGNLDGVDGRVMLPGVLAMPSDKLYLVDAIDNNALAPALRTIDLATGALATLERLPDLAYARVVAVDPAGNLYDAPSATGPATAIYRTALGGTRTLFAGATGQTGGADGAGTAARFTEVLGLAADGAGNLYVNDGRTKIRKISSDGTVVTLAGGGAGDMKDGSGAQATFQQIGPLGSDRAGNLTVVDNGVLRSVSAAGVVTTRKVVTDPGDPLYLSGRSFAVDGSGNAYVQEGLYPHRIRRIAPDGTVATVGTLPGLSGASYTNLVADAAGNLYVGDDSSQAIHRITPAGAVSVFAGRAVAAANVDGSGAAAQFSLAATRAYDTHYELAADAQGSIYVGEIDRVRKVTPAGVVITLALPPGNYTTSYYPTSEAVDGSALAVSNGVISRIDAAGVSHFIAGQAGVAGIADGVGAKATFTTPTRLVEDEAGNIWLRDTVPVLGAVGAADVYYRKIAPDGTVTTLPGDPVGIGYRGKDGTVWTLDANGNVVRTAPDGTRTVVRQAHAGYEQVTAMVVDHGGNLYLAMQEGADLYSVHKITAAGTETVVAGTPGAVGARAGTPGSLGPIDAITVAPDGTVYVMSQDSLMRILQ
jgi:hypothetical protein